MSFWQSMFTFLCCQMQLCKTFVSSCFWECRVWGDVVCCFYLFFYVCIRMSCHSHPPGYHPPPLSRFLWHKMYLHWVLKVQTPAFLLFMKNPDFFSCFNLCFIIRRLWDGVCFWIRFQREKVLGLDGEMDEVLFQVG